MKINFSDEDHESLVIAMEVGYQALADLATLYKKTNNELLKQLSIMHGKSTKEIKQEINKYLMIENKEKEYKSKIKASQEVIKRYNSSFKN